MSDIAKERAEQANPGDFDKDPTIMNDDVTGDNTTNGISASMVRFGDMDGIKYADEMDQLSEEFEGNP
ncbi:MAG: hypothetical protein HDQ87_03115 [Clostridia bacterium]|nr:hypothetical protein [Clostridia bacterium]